MPKLNLSLWELEELVPTALGKTEQEVEDLINESYDLEDFIHEIIEKNEGYTKFLHEYTSKLMDMIFMQKSELSGEIHKGFAIDIGGFLTAKCKMVAERHGAMANEKSKDD